MSKQLRAGEALLAANPNFLKDWNKRQSNKKTDWFLEWRKDFAEYCDQWQKTYGEPYPLTIEELEEWIRRADIPGQCLPAEKIASGDWTARDIMPFVQGYLRKQKDAERLAILKLAASESELSGRKKPEARGQGDKTGDKKKKYVRQLNAESLDCIRIYNAKKRKDGKRPSMKAICKEYAETNSGSWSSIYQTVKDHPAEWKGDKTGDKDV